MCVWGYICLQLESHGDDVAQSQAETKTEQLKFLDCRVMKIVFLLLFCCDFNGVLTQHVHSIIFVLIS